MSNGAVSAGKQVANFNLMTRNMGYDLPSQSRASGGGNRLRFDIPSVGLVARIKIDIRGVIGTVTGTPHVMGQAAIVKNIRLQTNANYDLFNCSGPGYFGLLAPYLDFPGNVIPASTAWTAIASAGAVNLPVVVPCAVNLRDVTGLLAAQNKQTLLTLWVEFETDTNLAATSITWTTQPVVTPTVEYFQIPDAAYSQPPVGMLHQIIEQTENVSASGVFSHEWQRGNIYLQKIHGFGFQVTTPADNWTYLDLKVQQTQTLYHKTPANSDLDNGLYRLQSRRPGVIPFDFIAQSGMGVYDIPRDALNSIQYSDVHSVMNATGSGTFYTISRQLLPLAG